MSKVQKVIDILTQRIEDGIYKPDIRIPSEYELSDDLGINRVTVNKAISSMVTTGVLKRGKSSRDGTYVVDQKYASKGTIGICIRIPNSWDRELLNGVIMQATMYNYLVIVTSPQPEELQLNIERMTTAGVKGIVIANYGSIQPLNISLPHIYADCLLIRNKPESVISDVYDSAYKMTKKFLESGHREIIFIQHIVVKIKENPRCKGVYDALKDFGVKNPEEHFYSIYDRDVKLELKNIMTKRPNLSCLIAEDDLKVAEFATILKELNYDYYKKLTLAGFGNQFGIQKIFPFPTVEQSFYDVAKKSIDNLMTLIKGEKLPTTSTVVKSYVINEELIPKLD